MKKNINDQKHDLLEFLTKSLLDSYGSGKEKEAKSFEEIMKYLDVDKRKVWEIASELLRNDELAYYKVSFEGFIATDIGLNAFLTEKYPERRKNKCRDNVRFYLSIFIPVASLIIAFLALLYDVNLIEKSLENRIEKNEIEILELKNELGEQKQNKLKNVK